jgi:hypothetical protein
MQWMLAFIARHSTTPPSLCCDFVFDCLLYVHWLFVNVASARVPVFEKQFIEKQFIEKQFIEKQFIEKEFIEKPPIERQFIARGKFMVN